MVLCNKCGKEYPDFSGYFYQRKNGQFMRPCKACIKSKAAARYESNVQEINKARAERMRSDPDYRKKKLLSDAASYRRYKADRLAKQKAYRSRPSVKEKLRQYFKALRDVPGFVDGKRRYLKRYHATKRADPIAVMVLREKGRQWARDNPEKMKAATRNRRARLRLSNGKHTAADVCRQLDLQQGKCYWCGRPTNGKHTVDHYVPIARGGSNGPENIVIACASCNYRKQDKLPDEFLQYLNDVANL